MKKKMKNNKKIKAELIEMTPEMKMQIILHEIQALNNRFSKLVTELQKTSIKCQEMIKNT